MERLQAREKIRLRHGVARADDELAGEKLPRLRELFFAALNEPQRVGDIFLQELTFTR